MKNSDTERRSKLLEPNNVFLALDTRLRDKDEKTDERGNID